jgi:hypothetical protein
LLKSNFPSTNICIAHDIKGSVIRESIELNIPCCLNT